MTVTVRAAYANEIPALVEYEGEGDRNTHASEYLAELLEKDCTRPEWCFVAESLGQLVGSAVLWALPGGKVPSDIVLLEAPWRGPDLGAAEALLRVVCDAARSLGAETLGHVMDLPAQPPQVQHYPEEREELLRRTNFTLIRDGCRFRWEAGGDLPTVDPRLSFQSLADGGRAPFIDLLADVLRESADQRLAADVARYGPRKAAERLFEDMSALDHRVEWFEIGYNAAGQAVAVSMPARNPSHPVIGFVGVAPSQRGLGYAAAVVARGTRVLAESGASEIRGDCDAANIAMIKGFQHSGYHHFARRHEFSRNL